MIPKVATNMWHFSAARVAAATQQTVVTPTFRTVLQQQAQAAQAQASQASTTVGWNAGANAAGATSSGTSNAASAKFNAGGRFYNAYQQGVQDPSFAANQQDEEEKKKKSLVRRPVRPMQVARRHPFASTPSPNNNLVITQSAAKLAHARFLQTQAHYRAQQAKPEEAKAIAPEGPEATPHNAVVLSPKRRYATSTGAAAPGPAPAAPAPEPPVEAKEEAAEESAALEAAEEGETAEERILSESFPEDATLEVDDAYPEYLAYEGETLAEAVVEVDASRPSKPSSPYQPSSEWVASNLPTHIRARHPSLHSIIYLTRHRPNIPANPSSLSGTLPPSLDADEPPSTAAESRKLSNAKAKDFQARKQELARHIELLRADGVRDSLTWSYALWSTIVLRAPGEPLSEAIGLYNDLLSGTFVTAKPRPVPTQQPAGETRKSWRDIEAEYEVSQEHSSPVIVPTHDAVALLIRALALRDHEVHHALQNLEKMHTIYSPLRRESGQQATTTPARSSSPPRHTRIRGAAYSPVAHDIGAHISALEKENNFAPAMALVNATLQNRRPQKLGVVTYNLLLQSALNYAKLQAAAAADGGKATREGVEVGGVQSAITVFAHLEKSDCRPNGRTFMLLLQIYGAAGDLEGAKEVWNEFRASCARGSIEWVLHDAPEQAIPAQKDTKKTKRTHVMPWSERAGPVAPDQPLSKAGIRSMISVWTTMIQTYFTCGDAAGGLSLLEKMMDAPWRPAPAAESAEAAILPESILTTSDVPPPSSNTYFGVIKAFLDQGDVSSAIPWFKRLLEQEPIEGVDTLGKKRSQWVRRKTMHRWDPIAYPPRPNLPLWDWMCQTLYERGMVGELNELMDYADALVREQADAAVAAATNEMGAEKMQAMTEEERNRFILSLLNKTMSTYDKRDHLHWRIVWRTNVAAMESTALTMEEKAALLDWLRTRIVDRVFFDQDVAGWSITARAADADADADAEATQQLPLRHSHRTLFLSGQTGMRDRAWHAVGLYVSQGRIDESIFLASKLFNLERSLILDLEREGAEGSNRKKATPSRQQQNSEEGNQTLHALADLNSLVAGLEERIWTFGSEARKYPSLEGLVCQLRMNAAAGILPSMRAAWYSVNAFLAHRDSPQLSTVFSENSDWILLAQVFNNTSMSIFYEENRPAPNPEMVWQLVTFLQILHANGKTLADVGKHNVYRLYKILEYHLSKEELNKLFVGLGTGFEDPEKHFPTYVKHSGAGSSTPKQKNSAKLMDVQASVDEARARYGRASSVEADSPVAPYTSNENRALPLKITPAQSSFIQEGVRKAGTNGESAVSPQVAFERLVAGFRTGEVPTPENIARLIISLSFHKEKDKIIKCYEIGNEVLASLAVNKSWQASGWVALEDAMVTALAHCGDMKAASIHRSRMVAQGSAPTASAYGALIANIKDTTDNAAVAIELFEESRRLNVEPNAYLYNTIISRLAKARKTDYAMMLFQAMKTAGLAPTEVTYGAIIAGCARIGDAHLAEILFEEMRALPGYQARIPPFNTMMQLYTHVKPNRERALHYYELMEQMGVQPSPYTYKLLLDVYGKVEPMSIEKMEEVLETMKSRGVEVTGNHYSSIIIARGCAMQDLDGALKIFNSLQTSSRQVSSSLWPMGRMTRGAKTTRTTLPDVLAYEALLTVLVNHHRIDLMQQYYDRMIKKDRVRPTAYINNLLIKGWASAGDIQAARDVFEGMMDPAAGAAAPNNHAPHVGIDGNQISGSSAGSPKDPVYREPSSWEAMIRAELSAGDRERANALLHRMKSRFYPAAVTAKIEGILWAPDIPQTVERSPDF